MVEGRRTDDAERRRRRRCRYRRELVERARERTGCSRRATDRRAHAGHRPGPRRRIAGRIRPLRCQDARRQPLERNARCQRTRASRRSGHRQLRGQLPRLRRQGMERVMSFTLTCEKGDSMSKIAAENGFADYNTVWQCPENAQLRQQRDNPNVLSAGDQVFVPDKQPKTVTAATGSEHKYTLKGKATRLRLLILDFAGSPLKNASLQLTVDGQTATVTTDAQG